MRLSEPPICPAVPHSGVCPLLPAPVASSTTFCIMPLTNEDILLSMSALNDPTLISLCGSLGMRLARSSALAGFAPLYASFSSAFLSIASVTVVRLLLSNEKRASEGSPARDGAPTEPTGSASTLAICPRTMPTRWNQPPAAAQPSFVSVSRKPFKPLSTSLWPSVTSLTRFVAIWSSCVLTIVLKRFESTLSQPGSLMVAGHELTHLSSSPINLPAAFTFAN
ncbi:hypothetical protein D3C76_776830 [compost metagenome]